MSVYKDKNLDRNILLDSIPKIAEQVFDEKVEIDIIEQTQSKMINISSETKQCKIQLFFIKKGTTTVNPDVGQNQELSNIIAEILVDRALIDERSMFSFCIQKLSKEELEYLIQFLTESGKAKILSDSVTSIYRLVKFQGVHNDTLTMKIYNNGTTQFQGRPINLYKDVTYYLSEICKASDIVKAQEQFYNIDINQSGIESEYYALFSRSAVFLGDTLKQVILPSFALRRVEVELTDYTLFVFPVLKGLEGYIKKLFLSKGIIINRDGFGDLFFKVSGDSILRIKSESRTQINCIKTCTAIEQSYDYLRNNRNSLFHVDGMIEPTRTLNTRAEAEELIDKTVEIIEFSYGSLV